MQKSIRSEEKAVLSDQITAKLIAYIREHQLKSGDILPNEKQLMELFHVSRSTIREAVRVLASRRIVVVRQGAGTFVSDAAGVSEDPLGMEFMYDQGKLIRDIFELRYMLEPMTAALCAQRASMEDREELIRIAQEIEFLILTGADYSSADVRFHCKLAEVTENSLLQVILPEITRGIRLFISSAEDTPMEISAQVHKEIALMIYKGDPDGAREAMIRHLEFNRDILAEKGFDVSVQFQQAPVSDEQTDPQDEYRSDPVDGPV